LPSFQGLSKAVSHIRLHYGENLSIRELGRLAGTSERQMERNFKTYFGISPQQYIIRTRLMAACRRLAVTDENLAEIAFACGFSKPSAFAFYFRRELGMTPSEFRRRQVSGAAQA
jgi:transcriptional regulator GlxA family with amidase domain